MSEELIPTESHRLFGGAVEVHCFGTRYGNWSMAGKTPEEAEMNNPGIIERMRRLADQFNCAVFAPNPSSFNAMVVGPNAFHQEWIENSLIRGPMADGVYLRHRNMAFGVTSADCPTVILHDPCPDGLTVAAHAGRDSLIDRAFLESRSPERAHESVVSAMLSVMGSGAWHLRAFIACGISPHRFSHPFEDEQHGQTNRLITDYIVEKWGATCVPGDRRSGRLWLTEIIRRQLADLGLDPSHIGCDGVDTYDDRDETLKPHWYSRRRARATPSTPDGRNLMLVIRR
ncbi:MAG: laccase domain-containing protein [Patescibacteria group bacterium]|jgi:copper oxidase (laccase) domain-containing protein